MGHFFSWTPLLKLSASSRPLPDVDLTYSRYRTQCALLSCGDGSEARPATLDEGLALSKTDNTPGDPFRVDGRWNGNTNAFVTIDDPGTPISGAPTSNEGSVSTSLAVDMSTNEAVVVEISEALPVLCSCPSDTTAPPFGTCDAGTTYAEHEDFDFAACGL